MGALNASKTHNFTVFAALKRDWNCTLRYAWNEKVCVLKERTYWLYKTIWIMGCVSVFTDFNVKHACEADWAPLPSLRGTCCEKLDRPLSSQHLALRSVYEHMDPLVPPPGGLPPNPHLCDLTGARASPPQGPLTTQALEQIAQRLCRLLYGRWFLALLPEHAGTSKSHTQAVDVFNLGLFIAKPAT